MRTLDIEEALEVAAGIDIATGFDMDRKRFATPAKIASTRRVLVRFLENVDDDVTVGELRQELEQ